MSEIQDVNWNITTEANVKQPCLDVKRSKNVLAAPVSFSFHVFAESSLKAFRPAGLTSVVVLRRDCVVVVSPSQST